MKQYALLLCIMSTSLYPLSTTDRAILNAARTTGTFIAGIVGFLYAQRNADASFRAYLQTQLVSFAAAASGFYLSNWAGKTYLKRKYKVNDRILNIAYQFNYDLATKQKLILQAAEQKNNSILKKYFEELFEEQFGENGTQKFLSLLHEFQLIAYQHTTLNEESRLLQLFIQKIGYDNFILLITILQIGIVPIALLYFDIDKQPSQSIKLVQKLMEAIGFHIKNRNPL